jgi:copper chaperone
MTGQLELLVTADACERCAQALVQEVGGVSGVTGVHLDARPGRLTVGYAVRPDPAAMAAAIDEAGFSLR